jgi:hypothetical protein
MEFQEHSGIFGRRRTVEIAGLAGMLSRQNAFSSGYLTWWTGCAASSGSVGASAAAAAFADGSVRTFTGSLRVV